MSSSANRSNRSSSAPSTPRSTPSSKPRHSGSAKAKSPFSMRRRPPRPPRPTTWFSAALGSYGSNRRSDRAEHSSAAQCFEHRREMLGGGAVEAFEPVLIEERGERRLAESCLPEDPEERGRRFVGFPLQRRQRGGALGRNTIERVRTRPQPELDEPSPFGRSEHEMGDFVQDDI